MTVGVEGVLRSFERRLQQVVRETFYDLVPEFRSNLEDCPECHGVHEWLRWRHEEGTDGWRATCPTTGVPVTVHIRPGTTTR